MQKNLILLFNGWAMDALALAHLQHPDFELQIIPFSSEKLTGEDWKRGKKNQKIYLIAYSLGVYQAHLFLQKNPDLVFQQKIAINGTSAAIDAKYGIHPKIFQQTVDNLSPENMRLFYQNIGYPLINTQNWRFHQDELEKFQQNYIALPNLFTKAIISQKDLIFTVKNQEKFYENIAYKIIPEKHYPFLRWKNWGDLLGEI
jgi:hypothetical protein